MISNNCFSLLSMDTISNGANTVCEFPCILNWTEQNCFKGYVATLFSSSIHASPYISRFIMSFRYTTDVDNSMKSKYLYLGGLYTYIYIIIYILPFLLRRIFEYYHFTTTIVVLENHVVRAAMIIPPKKTECFDLYEAHSFPCELDNALHYWDIESKCIVLSFIT